MGEGDPSGSRCVVGDTGLDCSLYDSLSYQWMIRQHGNLGLLHSLSCLHTGNFMHS